MFTSKDVFDLRAKTGVGMMACKKALEESNGDIDKAIEILRKKGVAAAEKRVNSIAAEGRVESYIHMGGSIGVLVEINCETDFVGRGDAFKTLTKDIAMHIAAAKPLVVTREELDKTVLDKEVEILKAQAINEGKPAAIVEKMVAGRIEKYYKEVCLMDQPFVKDDSKTITEIVNEAIQRMGEKISIRRFARFEMGEGIEKKKENFAEEIAKQVKSN